MPRSIKRFPLNTYETLWMKSKPQIFIYRTKTKKKNRICKKASGISNRSEVVYLKHTSVKYIEFICIDSASLLFTLTLSYDFIDISISYIFLALSMSTIPKWFRLNLMHTYSPTTIILVIFGNLPSCPNVFGIRDWAENGKNFFRHKKQKMEIWNC